MNRSIQLTYCLFGILVIYVTLSICTGQGHQHGHQHGGHNGGGALREDPQHVQEHMEGKFDKPVENMTQEELTFHYFKFHDYDNNNRLDGLELIKAVTHYDAEQAANDPNMKQQQQSKYNDEYFSNLIDGILNEGDSNKDGYIDYVEFVRMQHRTQ